MTTSSGADTPLVPGTVYGLRSWAVAAMEGEDGLEAPFTGVRWPSGGDAIEARCLASADHQPPSAECSCGIYAFHPGEDSVRELSWALRKDPANPSAVHAIGIVEAWGSVEVHDSGFRAEYARPHALVLFERTAQPDYARRIERLADTYHADLVRVRDPEGLRRHCVENDLGLSEQAMARMLGPEFAQRRRRSRRAGRRQMAWHATLATVLMVMLALSIYVAVSSAVWD